MVTIGIRIRRVRIIATKRAESAAQKVIRKTLNSAEGQRGGRCFLLILRGYTNCWFISRRLLLLMLRRRRQRRYLRLDSLTKFIKLWAKMQATNSCFDNVARANVAFPIKIKTLNTYSRSDGQRTTETEERYMRYINEIFFLAEINELQGPGPVVFNLLLLLLLLCSAFYQPEIIGKKRKRKSVENTEKKTEKHTNLKSESCSSRSNFNYSSSCLSLHVESFSLTACVMTL